MEGQCKKDFEKWMKETYKDVTVGHPHDMVGCQSLSDAFKYIPPSMQWGVIVDFFDSVGIYINIEWWQSTDLYPSKECNYFIVAIDHEEVADYLDTRQEARAAAIEKATEIYNEKFK